MPPGSTLPAGGATRPAEGSKPRDEGAEFPEHDENGGREQASGAQQGESYDDTGGYPKKHRPSPRHRGRASSPHAVDDASHTSPTWRPRSHPRPLSLPDRGRDVWHVPVINHPDAFAGCDKSEAGTSPVAR